MDRLRNGMVRLGGISRKAYLPVPTKEEDWEFFGAFSPNSEKRKSICRKYRIAGFASLQALAEAYDAAFVHRTTTSHFEVVSELLKRGKDVYVDKTLAASISVAEQLVE